MLMEKDRSCEEQPRSYLIDDTLQAKGRVRG